MRSNEGRAGFTLIEVVVALVVFQVGLLGVVGTLLLASQTLRRAEVMEWAAAEVQRATDSLSAVSAPSGEGRAASGPGELVWRVDGGGRFTVEYRLGDDLILAVEGSGGGTAHSRGPATPAGGEGP